MSEEVSRYHAKMQQLKALQQEMKHLKKEIDNIETNVKSFITIQPEHKFSLTKSSDEEVSVPVVLQVLEQKNYGSVTKPNMTCIIEHFMDTQFYTFPEQKRKKLTTLLVKTLWDSRKITYKTKLEYEKPKKTTQTTPMLTHKIQDDENEENEKEEGKEEEEEEEKEQLKEMTENPIETVMETNIQYMIHKVLQPNPDTVEQLLGQDSIFKKRKIQKDDES